MAILTCGMMAAGFLPGLRAEASAAKFLPLPERLCGSMMPLDTAAYQPAAVPDSLQPFFIDYLARHGARYMSSARKTATLTRILQEASAKGQLSATGKKFLTLLQDVNRASEGRWGLLSDVGEAEQRFLGRWLLREFPDVMGKGGIECQSSYVPRVVQTMYGLTSTLVTRSATEKALRISTAEGEQFDPQLRFFETDTAYVSYLKRGDWFPVWYDWARRNLPEAPARRLFGKECPLGRDELQATSFQMYEMLQSLICSGLGVPTTEWMTEGEFEKCWQSENLDKYLRRTWTSVSDEPVRAAVPLMMDMLLSADRAIQEMTRGVRESERTNAVMRFGHAETLMPVLALMNIPGCFATCDNIDTLPNVWRSYDVVPMGANFLTVLLRSRTGRVYAMTCLNGRWVDPLHDGRRIVPYNLLRQYWLYRAASVLQTTR